VPSLATGLIAQSRFYLQRGSPGSAWRISTGGSAEGEPQSPRAERLKKRCPNDSPTNGGSSKVRVPVPAGTNTDEKAFGPDLRSRCRGSSEALQGRASARPRRSRGIRDACRVTRVAPAVFFGSLHSRRASARHRVSTNRPPGRGEEGHVQALWSLSKPRAFAQGAGLKRQVSSTQPSKENPTDGSSYRSGRPEVLLDGRGPKGSAEPDGSVPGFRKGNSLRRVPIEDALRSRFESGNNLDRKMPTRECAAHRAHAPQRVRLQP
jgi:hypothetical protein